MRKSIITSQNTDSQRQASVPLRTPVDYRRNSEAGWALATIRNITIEG